MEKMEFEEVKKFIINQINSMEYGDKLYLFQQKKSEKAITKMNLGFINGDLLNMLAWASSDVIKQMADKINPDTVQRIAIKYEKEGEEHAGK